MGARGMICAEEAKRLTVEELVGSEYFARAPDSDIWVSVRDSSRPDAGRDLEALRENKGRDLANWH
jgi:hypothetical protein